MKNKIITELPKKKRADKEIIEWSKVENTVIVGIYEEKEYEVLIKGIDPNKKGYLLVKLKDSDRDFISMLSSHFKNMLWGNIIEDKFGYKYDIGDIIKSGKHTEYRVLDRYEKNKHSQSNKYYKLECLKCRSIKEYMQCEIGKHDCKDCVQDFLFNIGDVVDNGNMKCKILNREYIKIKNRKWRRYDYECLNCGYEGNIEENKLNTNRGCPCCSNKIAVLGINTIWDTDRWMCELGLSEEDAKTHTHRSNKRVEVICPDCGKPKTKSIDGIYSSHSIGCSCSQKNSYPERVLYTLLMNTKIDFITQLSKKHLKWCEDKRYDFYFKLNNEEYIVETHGSQHYESGFERCGGRTLEEEQANDKYKYELAISNGIKPENYIVIDCRKSEFNFIKNNIINSRLSNLLNLSDLDWDYIFEKSLKNIVKEICEKRKETNKTTGELSKIYNIGMGTISDYLKIGNKLNWCNYDPKEEAKRSQFKKEKNKL